MASAVGNSVHLATMLKLCTKSKIEIETGQKLFTMHFEHQLVLFPSSFVNEEKEKIRHQQWKKDTCERDRDTHTHTQICKREREHWLADIMVT